MAAPNQYLCPEGYPVCDLHSASSINKHSWEDQQYAANLALASYASFPVLLQ